MSITQARRRAQTASWVEKQGDRWLVVTTIEPAGVLEETWCATRGEAYGRLQDYRGQHVERTMRLLAAT